MTNKLVYNNCKIQKILQSSLLKKYVQVIGNVMLMQQVIFCEEKDEMLAQLIHSFIHSFIYSFIQPFILSFNHSFIHSTIHSFIQPFIHSTIHSFNHSFIHSTIHSFIHSGDLYSALLQETTTRRLMYSPPCQRDIDRENVDDLCYTSEAGFHRMRSYLNIHFRLLLQQCIYLGVEP